LSRRHLHTALAILALFALSACASSKKQNFISRAYHDITARDNGYFNAKLLLAQSSEYLWEGQLEDFSQTLPVYKYGSKEGAQEEQVNLDEVIKKSSIVIQLHKKSKWVDDCYLLIGKANFYKKEYEEAITSFQYIVNQYENGSGDKKKKRKKKKSDEENFMTKISHQPVANEAALWIVKSLIESGKYSDAKTALSVIKGNEKFPESLLDELYATEAHLYWKQKQYPQCIESLSLAAEATKDKALKARYNFILAQLHETQGNFQGSIDAYNEVIRLKPDYVTDFYARLYIATQSMQNFGMSSDNTVNTLKDMLKEDKYREFFPLIYNTLADIELAKKQEEPAIHYLRKGVITGDVDPEEKAISYMKLGDIFYNRSDFKPAFIYYDSSLQTLTREHARRKTVVDRRDGLEELVKALNTIETERRLQYLAGLSEYELELEIDKMIAEDEAERQEFLDGNTGDDDRANNTDGSSFYFYNASLLTKGASEFKLKWGTRSLEDDWRRSDKSSFSEETDLADGSETPEAEDSEIDLNSDKLTREQIISSLPTTEEEMAESINRIAGALYRAGAIYRQKFGENEQATDYFEQNINDFPENPFELQSLYQLYVIFDGSPRQDQYATAILDKYPESLFANIIKDPEYLERQLKKDEEIELYYAATYDLYTGGDLTTASKRLNEADSLFPENPLQPKFDMLKALLLADPSNLDAFAAALQEVIDKHSGNEVADKAKAILQLIGAPDKVEEVSSEDLFKFKGNEEHYAIMMLPGRSKLANDVKNQLSNFNSKNFSLKKLRISSLLFGSDQTLVLIKTFTDAEDGLNYYDFVNDSFDEVFDGIDMEGHEFFIISKANYVQLYKSKELDVYVSFFEQNYISAE
jgi:tetratricopeptide (TPR) repeat protein